MQIRTPVPVGAAEGPVARDLLGPFDRQRDAVDRVLRAGSTQEACLLASRACAGHLGSRGGMLSRASLGETIAELVDDRRSGS